MKFKVFVYVSSLVIVAMLLFFITNTQRSLSFRRDFHIEDIQIGELNDSFVKISFKAHIGSLKNLEHFSINAGIYNQENNEQLNSNTYLFNPNKMGEQTFQIKHELPSVRYDYEAFVLLTVLDENEEFLQMEIETIGEISYKNMGNYITIEKSYFQNDSMKLPVVNNYTFPHGEIPLFKLHIKNENENSVTGGVYVRITKENDLYKQNPLYDGIIKDFSLNARGSNVLNINIPQLKDEKGYVLELFLVSEEEQQISKTVMADINIFSTGFNFSNIQTNKVEQNKLYFSTTVGLMGDLDTQDSLNAKYRVTVKQDDDIQYFEDTIEVFNRGMSETIRFHIPFSFSYQKIEANISLHKNDEKVTNIQRTFSIDDIKKANRVYFEDVLAQPYHTPIADFYEAGIIRGYEDNTFRPLNRITRAEIMAILCGMLNLTESAVNSTRDSVFKDVDNNHWAKGFINIGNDLNLVSGYPGNIFQPERNISYAEIYTIAINLLGTLEPSENDNLNWPHNVIALAEKEGLTENIFFESDGFATRGDVTLILWKIWSRW